MQQKIHNIKKDKEGAEENNDIITKYNKICAIHKISTDPADNHVDEIIANNVEEK